MNSSKAYDSPADWVSGVYNSRFNDGDGLYDDVRTSSNGMGGAWPGLCRVFLWQLSS